MINKITDDELLVMELLSNPVIAAEILFSNIESNLGEWDRERCGTVRSYQYFFLSYDLGYIDDPELKPEENFAKRQVMAETINLGGRLTGKSRIGIDINVPLACAHKTFKEGALASYDQAHIEDRIEKIYAAFEFHPFFNKMRRKTNRKPYIAIVNGCLFLGINHNILGKNPGHAWVGKHVDRRWEEEANELTKDVTQKSFMSQSEQGCIMVLTGMTTFSNASPMGVIFNDLKNQEKLVNLPSYANPFWDEKKDNDAVTEFGGKQSPGYITQIIGRIIPTGETVFDMERIRESYVKDVAIKAFEVNKNNFYRLQDLVILDRPAGVEKVGVHADVGEGGAPTEIAVFFKIGDKWNYEYNITTFKLSPDEDQAAIEYIIKSVKFNVLGLDITSGGGKALICYFLKQYPKNVFGVSFNEKIEVDMEKDENGFAKTDSQNQPIMKYESVVDWSIHCLKQLFYNKKMRCLTDFKLDKQFEGVIVKQGKNKRIFGYKSANHLFQAFQVFAIVEWMTEFKNLSEMQKPLSSTSSVFDTF